MTCDPPRGTYGPTVDVISDLIAAGPTLSFEVSGGVRSRDPRGAPPARHLGPRRGGDVAKKTALQKFGPVVGIEGARPLRVRMTDL